MNLKLYKMPQTLVFFALVILGANLANALEDGYKLPRPAISTEYPFQGQFVNVMGTDIHYIEQGQGDPVLFIHGNPTSSYLWRNVIPFVSDTHRAIAIDLVGMGNSGKPDIDYTLQDHYVFLEKFIEALNLKNITLVVHDWGAALGFEYARRHEDNVAGIAFMEGALPLAFPKDFDELSPQLEEFFRLLKDPELGPVFVIEQNGFVEQILPSMVNRSLTEAEMNQYREPYLDISARKPLLVWPLEVPIEGEPKRNVIAFNKIGKFMQKTDLPLLLLYGTPGAIVTPDSVSEYISMIDDLETVFIGQGFHFLQEDQPEAIGLAISDWMRREINEED